jgi:hypothetical protein
LEVGIFNLASLIQEDFNLAVAFQPGDWVNRNSFHRHNSLSSAGAAD